VSSESKPRYPRPNTSDVAMLPRDLALLNELHGLRVAIDRLNRTLDVNLTLIAGCAPIVDLSERSR